MSQVRVQPCKIMASFFFPDEQQEPLLLEDRTLIEKLAPGKDLTSLSKLHAIRVGSYIGLSRSKSTNKILNFVLHNEDLSGDFTWVSKRDPSFHDRVIEVYKVEAVNWDGSTVEAPTRPDPELRTTP